MGFRLYRGRCPGPCRGNLEQLPATAKLKLIHCHRRSKRAAPLAALRACEPAILSQHQEGFIRRARIHGKDKSTGCPAGFVFESHEGSHARFVDCTGEGQ
jgi:hypothetical protein